MFRVVICDDEKIQRSILKEFTEKLLSRKMSKLSNTGIFLWGRFNIQIPRKN